MQLILWRHASASHYTGNDRALDPIGHKQAEQGGQWLAAHYPATPVGHLPWIGQLAAYLRGEHGYFPFNHGMILVFDGDVSGWQMRASFQPQPVSG